MKILKTKKIFTYLVVGALVIALSISCKSNEEPTDKTHSNHPPSGTYIGEWDSGNNTTAIVTTSGGTCNIKGIAYNPMDTSQQQEYEITITKWWKGDGNNQSEVGQSGGYSAGEANVISPIGTTSFGVYYNDTGTLRIEILFGGTRYTTAVMKIQV